MFLEARLAVRFISNRSVICLTHLGRFQYIRIVTVFHHIALVQSINVKYSLIYFGEALYSGASGSGYREQPLPTHDTD